jgi:undecaprenyl-diphosphatase
VNALVAADHAMFRAINDHAGGVFLDRFFLVVTDLGTVWLGATLALLTYWLRAKPTRAELAALSRVVTLGFVIGMVTVGLKWLFQRPRPSVVLENIHIVGPRLTMNSFPSGHTMTAFAILAVLFVVDRKIAWWALPLAVLVGFSRIYLGAHFPSDVFSGACIGFFGVYPLGLKLWSAPR